MSNKQEPGKSPLRVLLLNYEFPPLGGGAATATENFLKQCSDKGDIEFDVIVSSCDGYKVEKFASNITIHYLDIGKNGRIHDQSQKDLLTYSWKAFFYARRLKKQKKFDLIHAFFGVPCGFIAMFLGLPYIVSLRGSDVPFYSEKYIWLDRLFFWWLSQIIWSKAQRVVANSQGLKELALKTSAKQEIGVIYNGVDTKKFKPAQRKKTDELVVISASRIIQRKGIDKLLEGFIHFVKNTTKGSRAKLILIGDGDMKDQLEKMANKSGVAKQIEFTGPISREQMPEYYQQADIFALPSLNEGMSNALLESMASGLAVMATDTGGTCELVSEENGLIILKSSSDDIAEKLGIFAENPKKLAQMKKASRARAEQMSWRSMAEQYKNIYQKVVSK